MIYICIYIKCIDFYIFMFYNVNCSLTYKLRIYR
jgi:hypothetical protein